MNNLDLAALLESNFLSIIRSSTIFFVAGIALFNFTDKGKIFSIISLVIAFLLITAIVVDYFIERQRIGELGFRPRVIIDIVAYILIALAFLLIWIIYTVWQSQPSSIEFLAKDLEKEIRFANKELIANLKGSQIIPNTKELSENLAQTNYDIQQQGVNDAALAAAVAN
jgi:hypothetical protein